MERLGRKVVCAMCGNTLRYGEGDVSYDATTDTWAIVIETNDK